MKIRTGLASILAASGAFAMLSLVPQTRVLQHGERQDWNSNHRATAGMESERTIAPCEFNISGLRIGMLVVNGLTDDELCANDPGPLPELEEILDWMPENPCPPPQVPEAACEAREKKRYRSRIFAIDTQYRHMVCACHEEYPGGLPDPQLQECISAAENWAQQEIGAAQELYIINLSFCECVIVFERKADPSSGSHTPQPIDVTTGFIPVAP